MPLNSEQQSALEMVKTAQISILTGAPGTGKTFTLNAVLDWARSAGLSVLMASPTGKAAKQMEAATGWPASTIHRMLKPIMTPEGKFEFQKNKKNRLKAGLLVIDETSMITNSLTASVFRAVRAYGTKILIVGDHYQLPAVGIGAVLRDMIESDVISKKELTKIQRNSGDIVKACHRIKDGRMYEPSPRIDLDAGLNLRHLERAIPSEINQTIEEIVCGRMPRRGYDPIKDVQVMSYTNKNTEISCEALNKILQKALNKNPEVKNTKFRTGDKVIQIKNENMTATDGKDVLVVNGDMGSVTGILEEKKKILVQFDNPERTVSIPLRKHNLLLAYCVTCHRMQGSEAPVVVIPFHSVQGFYMTRKWVYTAISRAKEICITVGQINAIEKAVAKDTDDRRRTLLVEKLKRRV